MRMFPEILLCPRFNHPSQIKLCLLLVCAIKKVYEPIFSLLSMFLIFKKKTIFPCIKTICKKIIFPVFTQIYLSSLLCPKILSLTFCRYIILLILNNPPGSSQTLILLSFKYQMFKQIMSINAKEINLWTIQVKIVRKFAVFQNKFKFRELEKNLISRINNL